VRASSLPLPDLGEGWGEGEPSGDFGIAIRIAIYQLR